MGKLEACTDALLAVAVAGPSPASCAAPSLASRTSFLIDLRNFLHSFLTQVRSWLIMKENRAAEPTRPVKPLGLAISIAALNF
jgi:hypothetical protein